MAEDGRVTTDYAVGAYYAGEKSLVTRRKAWTPEDRGVIHASGHTFGADTNFTGAGRSLVSAIARRGMAVGSYDLGNTVEWGNDRHVSRISSGWTHLQGFAPSDRVLLLAVSMGAQAVVNWVRQFRDSVDIGAIALLLPAIDTKDIAYAEAGGRLDLAEWIFNAFGSEAGFRLSEPSHNAYNHAEALLGIPVCIWYSEDDPVTPVSRMGRWGAICSARMRSLGSVGHDGSAAPYAEMAAWLRQYA